MRVGSRKRALSAPGAAGDASSLAEEENSEGLTGAESNVFPGEKENVTVA